MPVTLESIPSGPLGWKSTSFSQWSPFTAMSTANNLEDWSGLYVSSSKELAEAYGSDYVDQISGNGSAFIHEVHLTKSLKVVRCTDAVMGSPSVQGSIKAAHIRANLPDQIKNSLRGGPLMHSLGKLGYVLKCFHDEECNVEIIIPNNLSSLLIFLGTREMRFRNFEQIRREPGSEIPQAY